MKTNLKLLLGVLLGALIAPFLAFAARTAVPLVSNLFPSGQMFVLMTAPVVSLPAAPGAGSLGAGTSLYIEVTALDGQGETIGGNFVSTTTTNSSSLQLTWPTVTGAQNYKVYFSTSTTVAFTQYFTATSTSGTPNAYYTFTSTTSPTYVSGLPSSSTAYFFNANQNTGLNWLFGKLGIGTSSPQVAMDVASGTMRAFSQSTTTCSAVNDGALFYHSVDKHLYVCESNTWQIIK